MMRSNDTFRLLTEEQAGALVGAIVAFLFAWDLIDRLREWLVR